VSVTDVLVHRGERLSELLLFTRCEWVFALGMTRWNREWFETERVWPCFTERRARQAGDPLSARQRTNPIGEIRGVHLFVGHRSRQFPVDVDFPDERTADVVQGVQVDFPAAFGLHLFGELHRQADREPESPPFLEEIVHNVGDYDRRCFVDEQVYHVVVRVLGERPFAIFEGCIEIGQDHTGHDSGGVVAEVSEVEENDRIFVENIPKVELVLGIIEDLTQVRVL